MLYPFTFHPVLKERIWGGRSLERLYHKPLPPRVPVGESWEITDRKEGTSVIANGPLAGRDIRWLMENHRQDLLGDATAPNGWFPWLVKILDARDVLSLQVHPPARLAAELGGEPKTEMWYVAEASPGAKIYAGLKKGVTREEFARRTQDGTVAECFHCLETKTGDVMFLPSGRVHALGAGMVIFEIQQNSDTTYRVFDWNRVGLDGKPRELHIEQSLRSIDFDDFEPGLVVPRFEPLGAVRRRPLVDDPLFVIDVWEADAPAEIPAHRANQLQVIGALGGTIQVKGGGVEAELNAGQFCLVPAVLPDVSIRAGTAARIISVHPGLRR